MAGVALSSLRVGADFDSTAYVRGAQAKIAADNQMIASDKARNAALAQSDAALARIPGGMASVSRSLLDGYGAGTQFEAIVRRIGNAVDRGMGLDRATLLLEAANQKFGMTADAAALAERGFVAIVPAIQAANDAYAAHIDLLGRSAAAEAAAQKAQTFQAGINTVTGVGTAPATNLGATFSALAEQGERAEKAAADLRAQIDPMGAEFGRLGAQMAAYKKLLDDGLISSDEFAAGQGLLAQRLTTVQAGLQRTGSAGGVAAGELTNLSYQLNDIVTGLASGQSPFMILAQQGGQVFQIFQTSKASVLDFASVITSKFLGLLSVGRVVWGGIAGAIGIGIAALISFQGKQQEVNRSLLGSGRASGATAGSINSIADAGSSRSGLSVAEARSFAATLAETGKIANDNILPIVQMGKDISTIFGTDATEAAKTLAQAFADPVKGAEDLNQRLGFLDAATKQNIANLVAQNKVYEAQTVLSASVKSSLLDVANTVSTTRTAWTALGNAVSNAWDSIGKSIYNVLNPLQGLDAQLDAAKRKLDLLQKTGGRTVDPNTGFLGYIADPAAIDAAQAQVDKLTEALQRQKKAAQDARDAQQSLVQQQAIRTALPIIGQTQDLQNQLKLLQDMAAAPDVAQKLKSAGQSMDELQRSIAATAAALAALPKTALVDFLGAAASPAERLAAGLEQIRTKAAQINATPAETGRATSALQLDIASSVQSARMSALGQSASVLDSIKQKNLELQRAQETGAGLTDKQIKDQLALARAQADGSLQIKAQADATTIQTATIGMSAGAAAEYTARMTALTDAIRNHKELTDQDKAAIDAQAKALGAAAQANALKQVQNDVRFGRQTALLSPDDVQIAQQLKSVYPDVATALASVEAQGHRTNAALSQVSSTISSDLVTGITDALDGTKSFGQAFSDTSKLVIRAIEEMIIKLLVVGPLMRSLQSSFSGLGGGADFGSLLGSAGVTFGTPGAAGSNLFGPLAPSARGNVFGGGNIIPFRLGGVVTRPTLFPMANGGTGLMGEAGEEAVMPLRRGRDGRLGVSAGGMGAANDNGTGGGAVTVNIYNAPAGSDPQTSVNRTANGTSVDVIFKNSVTGLLVDDATKNGPVSQAFAARQRGFGS